MTYKLKVLYRSIASFVRGSSQNTALQRRGAFTTAEEYNQQQDYSTLSMSEMQAEGRHLLSPIPAQMFAPCHNVDVENGVQESGVEAVEHHQEQQQYPPALARVPTLASLLRAPAPVRHVHVHVPARPEASQRENNEELLIAGKDDPWPPEWEDDDSSVPMDDCALVDYMDSSPDPAEVNSPLCAEAQPEEHWENLQLPPHRPLLPPVQVTRLPPTSAAFGSVGICEVCRDLSAANSAKPKMTLSKRGSRSPPRKRMRQPWSPELDADFRTAIKKFGGVDVATPRAIGNLMANEDNVPGPEKALGKQIEQKQKINDLELVQRQWEIQLQI